jgi:hypothetical protein
MGGYTEAIAKRRPGSEEQIKGTNVHDEIASRPGRDFTATVSVS